ncbi:MAG: 2'-5' RNA ligase [Gammaproteobacteria bacterium GWE2_37_16]|nr:MAG: 2'-5' RNA ligase [Gammaproteobacteria bacterium GWE2_37_16]
MELQSSTGKNSTTRTFIAITLSYSLQKEITKIIAQLKKEPLYHSIRWTKPKNLHLTLRFLGDITQDQLAKISLELFSCLSKLRSFTLQFDTLIPFPDTHSPIALVLKPVTSNELNNLAHIIDNCVLQYGVSSEKRAFHPHLTLARIKHKLPCHSTHESLAKIHLPKLVLEVKQINVMHSKPTPLGSYYKSLMDFQIGG